MANEKNDISDIVKKCKILLLDIEGTTTSISFVKDKLFPYAEENVKDFLNNEWESEDVKEAVAALRKLALEDEEKKVEGVVAIPAEDASKDEQIDGLVKSVKWQMSIDRKVGPLKQLQGLIWKKGYDKGDIKGHVYDDVSPALELWRSVEGQKVYIYSSGSVQAQKLLFGMSSAGDMLKLIDGHFDTAVGAKQETSSYTAIAEKIGCKAEEILFLTDIDKEAEAARSAGVQAALVSREGNAPLSEAITTAYPVLYSFTELAATKKRKPDAQDEQQPAKVPKTDVETDVKTPIETEVKDSAQPIVTSEKKSEETEKKEEIEKMEVEEETAVKEDKATAKLADGVEKIETTVEEVTKTKEVANIDVSDAKSMESTESAEKARDVMETEPVSDSKANGDKDASVPDETHSVVITEIKDITNDKESLSEGTETIEDLVPIVEEPAAEDMEELQNVGQVLEKECDEILSKVQDVTNLESIPLKPLHPIAEETMETENMDSNDIVEGILDTEQDLDMKKSKDIDLNTVPDISAAKPVTDSNNSEKQEVTDKPLEGIVEGSKTTEEVKEASLDTKNATEEKIKEPSLKADTSLTDEKVEKKTLTEEKETEPTLSNEKIKESNMQEKANEVISTEEKSKESIQVVEKAQENMQTEVLVKNIDEEVKETQDEKKDSNLAEDRVKKSCNTEERIKESSNEEEKVKETSIIKENVKDSSSVEQKVEDSSSVEVKTEEKKTIDNVVNTEDKVDTKMETDASAPGSEDSTVMVAEKKTEGKSETEEKQIEGEKSDAHSTKLPVETNAKIEESSMDIDQTETLTGTKASDTVESASTAEAAVNDSKETQVNGKATNGDADMVDLNGDASKDDELSSRLSMENGKEVVNGANGDSVEEPKIENNGDDVKEVADIKVKTVAMDEPRNDPIEQPTEA